MTNKNFKAIQAMVERFKEVRVELDAVQQYLQANLPDFNTESLQLGRAHLGKALQHANEIVGQEDRPYPVVSTVQEIPAATDKVDRPAAVVPGKGDDRTLGVLNDAREMLSKPTTSIEAFIEEALDTPVKETWPIQFSLANALQRLQEARYSLGFAIGKLREKAQAAKAAQESKSKKEDKTKED
jgi:hypothetical protein